MSILAYVGLPGSGKSYSVVENQILPALRAGRKVVTNIPLVMDKIRETISTGEVVDLPIHEIVDKPEKLREYATPGCVLVMDELWDVFPAGVKVAQVPRAYKSLLAEHRHMQDAEGRSMQVVFVTQDLSQLGAFARQLVEQTYLHRKLSDLGLDKAYRCDIYRGGVTGQNPPAKLLLRQIHGTYSADIYECYRSHTMSEAADGTRPNERTMDRRGSVWRRPIFIIIPVALVVVIVFGIPAIAGFFHRDDKKGGARGASVATAAKPPASSSAGQGSRGLSVFPERSTPPVVTGGWRYAGHSLGSSAMFGGVVYLRSVEGYVSIPFSRFCSESVEGWIECDYEGQHVSSAVRWYVNGSSSSAPPAVELVQDPIGVAHQRPPRASETPSSGGAPVPENVRPSEVVIDQARGSS